MQPTLAPAPPHQIGSSAQDIAVNDNDIRTHLALAISPHQTQGYVDGIPPNSVSQSDSSSSQLHHGLVGNSGGGSGQDMMSGSAGDSGDDDGRKGSKRELSQSKRAAQNRAAQRAFRQRKEGYIKKLEEQVREFHTLESNYKAIQTENYSLREYIIHLQSRLIESHGEYPQPPANVNLNHPMSHQPPILPPPSALHSSGSHQTVPHGRERLKDDPATDSLEQRALSQLQASAAQAVAAGESKTAAGRDALPISSTGS